MWYARHAPEMPCCRPHVHAKHWASSWQSLCFPGGGEMQRCWTILAFRARRRHANSGIRCVGNSDVSERVGVDPKHVREEGQPLCSAAPALACGRAPPMGSCVDTSVQGAWMCAADQARLLPIIPVVTFLHSSTKKDQEALLSQCVCVRTATQDQASDSPNLAEFDQRLVQIGQYWSKSINI